MTLKLAFRNIRRTIGDYAVYFVTLVLGVAVFYAFNSVESQQLILDIESKADASFFEETQLMLSMVSYAIAFVLGFLVVYANRFLIRRRKREFGTYLVLGTAPKRVAFIVLVETIVVGIVALVVGLLLGMLLSQGLAFATAALFGTTISDYQFVFSPYGFVATLICFAVIYVVVALFNVVSVSRFRLIDLLQAEKSSERNPVRNPWVCLAAFVVSIGLIAYAYSCLIEDGMLEIGSPLFIRATVFMLVGSLLFFWSLAGFVVAILSRLNGLYLRGIVPFTVRQFAAKINTAWVTLWTTCIMLFLAMTIFSTGMGLVDVFVGNIERATPYDATFVANPYAVLPEDEMGDVGMEASEANPFDMKESRFASTYALAKEYDFDVQAFLEQNMPDWDGLVKASSECDFYNIPGISVGDMLDAAGFEFENSNLAGASRTNVQVTPLSQYNAQLALIGEPPVQLGDGEYAFDNTLAAVQPAVDAVVEANVPLAVADRELLPSSQKLSLNLQDSAMDSTAFAIIVPDAVVEAIRAEGAVPINSLVNVMYVTPGLETDARIQEDLVQVLPLGEDSGVPDYDQAAPTDWLHSPWPVQSMYSQYEMRQQAGGLRMMITYLALYIGFVLLVATAAILAIQQLTESVDSVPRYRMLWRLGCADGMLYRSLFVQVLVYFLAPLVLATCHSACAIVTLSDTLFLALGGQDVFGPIAMAAGFTAAIYGCYLLVTFFVSRHVVKGGLRSRES